MPRFYSIPGCRNHQREDRPLRGSLPDIHGNPQFEEWLGSRKPTSHSSTGFEAGQFEHLRGDVCRVEGEERDQHTGRIEQYVQRSDPTGSGSYKVVWEPGESPRTMVISDVRRIHE